jgi:dsDNA-binding SOS-regulon protein
MSEKRVQSVSEARKEADVYGNGVKSSGSVTRLLTRFIREFLETNKESLSLWIACFRIF